MEIKSQISFTCLKPQGLIKMHRNAAYSKMFQQSTEDYFKLMNASEQLPKRPNKTVMKRSRDFFKNSIGIIKGLVQKG